MDIEGPDWSFQKRQQEAEAAAEAEKQSQPQPKVSLAAPAAMSKDALELAAANAKPPEYTPEEKAMLAAAMQGGGGGYRAAKVKLPGELEQGAQMALGGVEAEQQAMQRYLQDPAYRQAMADQAKANAAELTAEQGRATKLKELGTQREQLNREMKTKMENFSIDPERVFAQGPTRAAQTFGLGLANIMSNMGEAMQGKAGTNAVLGLVRDRIAQDIALQEHDYQRMMQGYQVQRNGLMDAVQQLGDERVAAQAVAKQQALVMADKLGQVAQQVGLTDAKMARPYLEARAKILETFGGQKLHVEEFNVHAENQARAAGAAAASAAASQRMALAQQILASKQMDPKDRETIDKTMEEARKLNLPERGASIQDLRAKLSGPSSQKILSEIKGPLRSMFDLAQKTDDPGVLSEIVKKASLANLSPETQDFMRSWQRYMAQRLVAQGGKSITKSDERLFNLDSYTTPEQFQNLLREEQKQARGQALGLQQSAYLSTKVGRDVLANMLNPMVPPVPDVPLPPPAPEAQ